MRLTRRPAEGAVVPVAVLLLGTLTLCACSGGGGESSSPTSSSPAGSGSSPSVSAAPPGERVSVQGLSIVLPQGPTWEMQQGAENDLALVRRWVQRPATAGPSSTPTASPSGSATTGPSPTEEAETACVVTLSVEQSTLDIGGYKELLKVLLTGIAPTITDDPTAPAGTKGVVATGAGPTDPASTASPFTSVLRAFLTPKGTLAKVAVVAPRPAPPTCSPEAITATLAWDGAEFAPAASASP